MYIIKNAFVSITRNKGRNVLISIIIEQFLLCLLHFAAPLLLPNSSAMSQAFIYLKIVVYPSGKALTFLWQNQP